MLCFQNFDEGFLRNVYVADGFHPFLAFLLLLEKLALARHVAAVAFGGDILAEGADRFGRDDFSADRSLDLDLELLPRDDFLQLLSQRAAAPLGFRAMHDAREG